MNASRDKKRSVRGKIRRTAAQITVVIACAVLLLPAWPVNYFTISTADEEDEVVLAAPVANADSFVTTYIHSLQLSPVADDYRVVGGKIWSWEERVQSHNAGLPFDRPEHGRFLVDSPWMIVQGGRRVFGTIVHRVGNEQFGRNTWHLPPSDEAKIYERYPGRRMTMRASVRSLREARTKGVE